jgi:flagellar biosynthesis protein FlhA
VTYNGVTLSEGSVPLDAVFTDLSLHGAASLGVPPISFQRHPYFAHRGVWVPAYMTSMLLDGELSHFSPIEFIALSAASYFVRNPSEILSLSDVHGFIKQLEKRSPGVVGDLLQNGVVSVATVTQLLHALVSQGVPVRDFRQIVEGIASYCSMKGAELPDAFDFQEMLYSVRRGRRRLLLSRVQASSGHIHVITLAEPISRLFEQAILPAREAEQLPPPIFEDGSNDLLRDGLSDCLERLSRRGAVSPPVIYADLGNRDKVARFLSAYFPEAVVITNEDLGLDFRIDRVATWELGRTSQLLTAGAGLK